MLWHGEVIYHNDKPVGDVRSGSYGHTLGGAVGLAMVTGSDDPVDSSLLQSGTWKVDIAGKRYPCTCSLSPMYDPKMARVKS